MNSPDPAIRKWRASPFPKGHPTNDELDEFKAELAYWDSMIAGDIITFQRSGTVQPGVLDNSIGLAELRSRIEARLPGLDAADRRHVGGYLDYLKLLIAAWEAVKARLQAE